MKLGLKRHLRKRFRIVYSIMVSMEKNPKTKTILFRHSFFNIKT